MPCTDLQSTKKNDDIANLKKSCSNLKFIWLEVYCSLHKRGGYHVFEEKVELLIVWMLGQFPFLPSISCLIANLPHSVQYCIRLYQFSKGLQFFEFGFQSGVQ